MKTIADEWTSFTRVLPVGVGATQYKETRRAFYAGCAAMFGLMVNASEIESMDVAEARMERFANEIRQWCENLQAGKV